MTTKLYYQDLYQKEFQANVISVHKKSDGYHVALDESIFYPGGGGQPCDTGYIDDQPVTKVYESEDYIYHIMPVPPKGPKVMGVIDWERRYHYMQQHLGQHILSAILLNEYHADTIGLRLTEEEVSIDINRVINQEAIKKAEMSANEVICSDLPVEVLYPSMDKIRTYSRREIPLTGEPIRIVKIGSLDYTPCCGTHNSHTGEVGLIKILGFEKVKGNMRIHFACGKCALHKMVNLYDMAEDLRVSLSCGYNDISEHVRKLKEDLAQERNTVRLLRGQIAETDAQLLLEDSVSAGAFKLIKKNYGQISMEKMKQVSEILTSQSDIIAVLGGETSKGAIMLVASGVAELPFDIRRVFQEGLAMIGGKGGGKSNYLQGFGQDIGALDSAVNHIFNEIHSQLDNNN